MTISSSKLTIDDRLMIHELIGLHGHLVDNGDFDRLDDLFTSDVVYDLRDYGGGELHGIDATVQASRALGDANPLGHHVTNVLILERDGDVVRVVSKGIGVRADGSAGSVVYQDEVRKDTVGWRIARRRVSPRTQPLSR
jgi:3-phenylpropionate/cinnamic acid dioxygenase small subunit